MEALIALALTTCAFLGMAWLQHRTVTATAESLTRAADVLERVHAAQGLRIEALENRLMAHDWATYAQLQNNVAGETEKFLSLVEAGVLRKPPSTEPGDPGYGATAEEQMAEALRSRGVDLEGPTVN